MSRQIRDSIHEINIDQLDTDQVDQKVEKESDDNSKFSINGLK